MKKFVKKKKVLGERAQSGMVFRLMVDGIIGLVILGIIVASISYFEGIRVETAKSEFYSLVKSATDSPGSIIKSEKMLLFVEGAGFSNQEVMNLTGYYEDCFKFSSNRSGAKVGADGKRIDIERNIETTIFVLCSPEDDFEYGKDNCPIKCEISFGKKLTSS
jgi:hypothetical protein